MSDNFSLAVAGVIGSLVTVLGQYLVAKLSARTKDERAAAVVRQFLDINEVTAERLLKQMNLVDILDSEVGKLEREKRRMAEEIENLLAKRTERDELFEAMGSKISGMEEQINKDAKERGELRKKLSEFEAKYRAMFQYLLALLEHMRKHDLKPPYPPKELESDPEIMRFVKGVK